MDGFQMYRSACQTDWAGIAQASPLGSKTRRADAAALEGPICCRFCAWYSCTIVPQPRGAIQEIQTAFSSSAAENKEGLHRTR